MVDGFMEIMSIMELTYKSKLRSHENYHYSKVKVVYISNLLYRTIYNIQIFFWL